MLHHQIASRHQSLALTVSNPSDNKYCKSMTAGIGFHQWHTGEVIMRCPKAEAGRMKHAISLPSLDHCDLHKQLCGMSSGGTAGCDIQQGG